MRCENASRTHAPRAKGTASKMIKVVRNPSFDGFYEILEDGVAVEEVQGRLKAKRAAMKMARQLELKFFVFLDESVDVTEVVR